VFDWSCGILRDIFENFFRNIGVNQGWLSWNDGAIPKIAQTIYDDRAFDRLPILADALEDAGATTPKSSLTVATVANMSAAVGSWI
jgi:hypothetical protein